MVIVGGVLGATGGAIALVGQTSPSVVLASRGTVVAIAADARSVEIAQEAIHGSLGATVVPFDGSVEQLGKLRVDDKVHFTFKMVEQRRVLASIVVR